MTHFKQLLTSWKCKIYILQLEGECWKVKMSYNYRVKMSCIFFCIYFRLDFDLVNFFLFSYNVNLNNLIP